MSTDNKQAQLAADIKALKEWWDGDRDVPYVLKQEERDYCACYLLFDSGGKKLKLLLQFVLIWFAQQMPFSTLKKVLYRLVGVKIGHDVFISPGVIIDPIYPELIELCDGCVLGLDAMLLTHEYTASDSRIGRIIIGKKTVVGARAVIRAGVSVGETCTIGACSFVNKDVADGQTVGGVPAKVIEKR